MTATIDRLLSLPEVFTLADLRRIGLEGSTAHTFLQRAHARIFPVGPRAAAYFNLIKDPAGPINRTLEAARKLYPSAVLGGAAVWHAAGWTTQIPTQHDVMVLSRRSTKTIFGVNLLPRNQAWYRMQSLAGNIVPDHQSAFGIATLKPMAALLDVRLFRDSWVPDLDDLDMDEHQAARSSGGKENAP